MFIVRKLPKQRKAFTLSATMASAFSLKWPFFACLEVNTSSVLMLYQNNVERM